MEATIKQALELRIIPATKHQSEMADRAPFSDPCLGKHRGRTPYRSSRWTTKCWPRSITGLPGKPDLGLSRIIAEWC